MTGPVAATSSDVPKYHGPAAGDRLIFDITSIATWTGPPVGIVRVVQELARYARDVRPDIVLAFYHPSIGYRSVNPDWAGPLIEPSGIIDPIYFLRRELNPLRRWLPSRYPAVTTLERMRLRTRSPAVKNAADILQRLLFLNQLVPPFVDSHGSRIAVIPPRLALGPVLSPGPNDIFLSAGYDWLHKGIGDIVERKRRTGFRLVVTCYDIIPLIHPEFFFAHDVATFRDYWTMMFPLADRIIVNSRRVEADVQLFCRQAGIHIGSTAVVPLGHQTRHPHDDAPTPLPAELEPNRYALFVSTIEPRKGHDLLLRVWRRLLADRVPQRHRFNLVFVGRRGWKVKSLLLEIDRTVGPDTWLQHYDDVPDQDLAALYRGAAFCLYPSVYEGFGLPVIEAYAYGKVVLASSGGALPETVGGLSPCLDPRDESAWYSSIRQWIEDPASRQPFEERIRTSFLPVPWREVAERYFDAASIAPRRHAASC